MNPYTTAGVFPSVSMTSRTRWTPQDVEQLEELAKKNFSLQIIALKLGRTREAVDAKATQLHIQLRRMKRAYRRKSVPVTDEQHVGSH
jgi:hypothetical protein